MSEAVDEAETLLVAGRFLEASDKCRSALEAKQTKGVVNSASSNDDSSSLPLTFGDLNVSLDECAEEDLLTTVMLQCGFELNRKDEYCFCHKFYSASASRRLPFPVALLWLRLRLAEGETDFSRRTLLDMADRLGWEGASAESMENIDSTTSLSVFSDIIEVLVREVLLPARGGIKETRSSINEARRVVEKAEKVLKVDHAQALLTACDEADMAAAMLRHNTTADAPTQNVTPTAPLEREPRSVYPWDSQTTVAVVGVFVATACAVCLGYRAGGGFPGMRRKGKLWASKVLKFVVGEDAP